LLHLFVFSFYPFDCSYSVFFLSPVSRAPKSPRVSSGKYSKSWLCIPGRGFNCSAFGRFPSIFSFPQSMFFGPMLLCCSQFRLFGPVKFTVSPLRLLKFFARVFFGISLHLIPFRWRLAFDFTVCVASLSMLTLFFSPYRSCPILRGCETSHRDL